MFATSWVRRCGPSHDVSQIRRGQVRHVDENYRTPTARRRCNTERRHGDRGGRVRRPQILASSGHRWLSHAQPLRAGSSTDTRGMRSRQRRCRTSTGSRRLTSAGCAATRASLSDRRFRTWLGTSPLRRPTRAPRVSPRGWATSPSPQRSPMGYPLLERSRPSLCRTSPSARCNCTSSSWTPRREPTTAPESPTKPLSTQCRQMPQKHGSLSLQARRRHHRLPLGLAGRGRPICGRGRPPPTSITCWIWFPEVLDCWD